MAAEPRDDAVVAGIHRDTVLAAARRDLVMAGRRDAVVAAGRRDAVVAQGRRHAVLAYGWRNGGYGWRIGAYRCRIGTVLAGPGGQHALVAAGRRGSAPPGGDRRAMAVRRDTDLVVLADLGRPRTVLAVGG